MLTHSLPIREACSRPIGVYKTPRVHLTMPVSEITEGLDMVLQTHIHPDHYDETVKQHLPKDIRYYVQPQDKATVEQDGFTRVEVIEDKATVEGMAIHRVSGHHGFGKIGEIMGPVSGYVLKAEGCPTVYIMGDCKWEACIRETVERFKPDYIVVNSAERSSRSSQGRRQHIPDEAEISKCLMNCPLQTKLISRPHGCYGPRADHSRHPAQRGTAPRCRYVSPAYPGRWGNHQIINLIKKLQK